jgi:hypothetical protein
VTEFLAGAVTLGHLAVGVCFLRFWKKTRDPLFLAFAFAFWLFGANQFIVSLLGAHSEQAAWAYVLRVLGYVLILGAIVGKNRDTGR